MKEVSDKPGFLNFRCVKLPQLPLWRVTPTTEPAAWKSRDGVQVNNIHQWSLKPSDCDGHTRHPVLDRYITRDTPSAPYSFHCYNPSLIWVWFHCFCDRSGLFSSKYFCFPISKLKQTNWCLRCSEGHLVLIILIKFHLAQCLFAGCLAACQMSVMDHTTRVNSRNSFLSSSVSCQLFDAWSITNGKEIIIYGWM